MQSYKEIREFYPMGTVDIEDQMKIQLTDGWGVIGIRYYRIAKDDGVCFTDEAIYILGRNPGEE